MKLMLTLLPSRLKKNFKKVRISRKHNEVRLEFEKISNGFTLFLRKDMQIQHN